MLKDILLYTWQLPQNLLGLVLMKIYGDCSLYNIDNGRRFYSSSHMPSGISLGNYIIFNRVTWGKSYRHEFGHSIQSRWLGWFYLPVIGLPSLIGNIWDRLCHKDWSYEERQRWYYSQPWEAWADQLGGVVRF